jgi:1-acyl-sn-glycerol-3-phosphate acyltransferase
MESTGIYYKTAKAIIRIFHFLLAQDCHVNGERGYLKGAKIIAGNHPNATDGLFLPFLFPEKLHFFIQGDLFSLPFFGWLLAKADQIPVIPGEKHLALEKAAHLLEEDKAVALFPEATLNPDGQPVKSGTGAVRLSQMTNTPIIPVGFYVPPKHLHYFERMRSGRKTKGHWQLRGRCYLHIGSPWLPGNEMDVPFGADALRNMTERLMYKINDQAKLAMQDFISETGLSAELASFNQH